MRDGRHGIINRMVEHPRSGLDAVFRALSDPTRRAMIRQLASSSCTISELSQPYDMSLAAASKHVKVLEEADLVQREIQGRVHHCSLNSRALVPAMTWLDSITAFRDVQNKSNEIC
ncbi:MAG: metalloregulator ArsR/SmtB family transcription factor [Microvirga sp.]